ncbi:MAG TPA: hypothetical protein VGN63_21635 [Flavisolibacter sp.]|jgi:hypothetical protein|nr:hypothetical protein [Flavisolibacter sp.]
MDQNNELAPRTFVVEMSVKIEHLLNVILSRLLGVNPDETRSLGTSSYALSFNAKANLLLDLNYLNKEQGQKFQIFMEVRNKFAHVYKVDTFEKCFALTKNYNQLKKLFDIDKDGENKEKDMEYMFISLSLDIANTLKEIGDRIYREMAIKYTQRRFTEAIKSKRAEYKLMKPSHAEAVDDFIDFIKTDLINEVDEKIKNNIPPHT